MNLLRRFGCLIFLLSSAMPGRAQSGAQLTLSQATYTAGDTVNIDVNNLEFPASCDTHVQVFFDSVRAPVIEFSAFGDIKANSTSAKISVVLAKDLDGGDYHAGLARLYPCPGFQNMRNFTVPPIVLSVKALPDTTQYPTRADLNLSVTQKQFFDTKIADLRRLDQRLVTEVAGKGADRPELRQFLTQIVQDADHDLTITQGQYAKQISKSGESLPPFFAEFHQRYAELVTKLKALPPDMRHVSGGGQPKIIHVQLQKREPSSPDASPHNSTLFPPSIVSDSEGAIKDNIGMYAYNRDTGGHTFEIDIRSTPQGARVSYQKEFDDQYLSVPGQTDIQKRTMEMLSYDFKFHLEGCPDQFYKESPYNEQVHEASVEFPKNCHRAR